MPALCLKYAQRLRCYTLVDEDVYWRIGVLLTSFATNVCGKTTTPHKTIYVTFELVVQHESAIRGYETAPIPSLRTHPNGDLVGVLCDVRVVKPSANVVLVARTSWKAQTDIALTEEQQAVAVGLPVPEVRRRAKLAAVFAGTAHLRFISLLDPSGCGNGWVCARAKTCSARRAACSRRAPVPVPRLQQV